MTNQVKMTRLVKMTEDGKRNYQNERINTKI